MTGPNFMSIHKKAFKLLYSEAKLDGCVGGELS